MVSIDLFSINVCVKHSKQKPKIYMRGLQYIRTHKNFIQNNTYLDYITEECQLHSYKEFHPIDQCFEAIIKAIITWASGTIVPAQVAVLCEPPSSCFNNLVM